MFKFLFALGLALLSSVSFAQSCQNTTAHSCGGLSPSAWMQGTAAGGVACQSNDIWNYNCTGPTKEKIGGTWYCTANRSGTSIWGDTTNTSPSIMAECPTGFGMDQNTGTCVRTVPCEDGPRKCPVPDGEQMPFNRTVGWATSSTAGTPIRMDTPWTGSEYDMGPCKISIPPGDGLTSEACYRSMDPSENGLYRVSCDYTGTVSGDGSGTPDPSADPNTAPPACPGAQGEVNGVPVCVPNSSAPPTSAPPNAGANPNGTGNPPAGPMEPGQTSSSGGGPRTPATGNGSNSGGPTGAFSPTGAPTGPGGEGEDPDGEESEPCGAPGQAVCAVKVDEAGVAAASTAALSTGAANTAMDTARNDAQSAISAQANDSTARSWSWAFQLPTGCSAIPLAGYGFSLNICEFRPVIHDLMSLLWVAAGIFGLLGLLRSAFNKE